MCQPHHPIVRVLTGSTVGALTSWSTGQSGVAPDRYCSLSGAPLTPAMTSARTVHALFTLLQTTVALLGLHSFLLTAASIAIWLSISNIIHCFYHDFKLLFSKGKGIIFFLVSNPTNMVFCNLVIFFGLFLCLYHYFL